MKRNKANTLKRLVRLFYPYRRKLLLVLICLVFYSVFSMLLPVANSYMVDKGILGKNYSLVIALSSGLILMVLINSVAGILKEKIRASIASSIRQNLVLDAFKSLSCVSIKYFNIRNSAEIVTNLEMDTTRICTICDSDFFSILTQLVGFIGGIVGLSIIDYRLALIVLIFIPLKFTVVRFLTKRRKALIQRLIKADQMFGRWLGESLDGMKEIRLFNLYAKKCVELEKTIFNRADSEKDINILDNYNTIAETIILRILESVLYIVGTWFIFNDSLTLGSLVAFLTYSSQVTNPISSALNISFTLSGIIPSAQRYFQLLDVEPEVVNGGSLALEAISRIEFDGVTFAYDERVVLDKVSFCIEGGQKVAIIGKNGTGKTTIFNLIERFIPPLSGNILINNTNINDYELQSYRQSFACINQDSYLFNTTIEDNITLYSEYDRDLVDKVMSQINIEAFNKKHNDAVGINGQNLSGGQRQKVIFARMLLRDKACYLLDEATSNLDKESEMLVAQALQTFLKDKTVLLIAHGMQLLPYVDKIIQLDGDGGVFEYPSLDALLSSKPDIKNLFPSSE